MQGELPLKAIRVITDDNEKQNKSFLLEGKEVFFFVFVFLVLTLD